MIISKTPSFSKEYQEYLTFFRSIVKLVNFHLGNDMPECSKLRILRVVVWKLYSCLLVFNAVIYVAKGFHTSILLCADVILVLWNYYFEIIYVSLEILLMHIRIQDLYNWVSSRDFIHLILLILYTCKPQRFCERQSM